MPDGRDLKDEYLGERAELRQRVAELAAAEAHYRTSKRRNCWGFPVRQRYRAGAC
jgi:hypothetical protein